MPLSDQDVTSVMDWLGRTQPVGQQQLSLATATGGAPTGGPVTPGGGLVDPGTSGGVRVTGGGTPRGGASPLTQAVGVADLVRRAAGLIPTASEVPGSLGGPGAFGTQIEAQGGAQGLRTLGTTTGGLEAGGAELGAAGAAESPAVLGTEAAGGGAGFGAAATGLGGAAGLAFGIKGALEAETDVGKAGGALSATGGALALASLLQPELLPFAIAVSLLGGGTSLFGGMFGGKPELTHAQRESKEAGQALMGAETFGGKIQGAESLDQLYQILRAQQTGYVGGTESPAVDVGLAYPGDPSKDVNYLGLYGATGAKQPSLTQEQFFEALRTDPSALYAHIQQGVNPALLGGGNDVIAEAIRRKLAELGAAPSETATAAAPTAGPPTAPGPIASGMVSGGPAGALGFSQEMLQAA